MEVKRLVPWLTAVFWAVLVVSVAMPSATSGQQAPAPAYRAPRPADGKPNLSGLWQVINEANWDLEAHTAAPGPSEYGALFAEPGGIGVVEGGAIPYQPAALEQKKKNFEQRMTRDVRDGLRNTPLDPESKCYLPGVPRATYMPFPFQIIQGTDQIVIAYAWADATRMVYMSKVPPAPADSWMGWSVGRWDGETLVVNVTDFNDETWFDRAGNFHSDQMKVVERYTRTSPDIIAYEATITDPKVFTRPWKISMPLYRRQEKNAQLVEFKCVPFTEQMIYGQLRKTSK